MNVMLLFDVIFLGYGLYTIYTAVKMKKEGKLSSWFQAKEQQPIRDERGYINYIFTRTIVLGIVISAFGVIQFINDYVMKIQVVMNGVMLLFFTVCVWFYIGMTRGKQKFW